ncbi:replication-relaxation family protein [Streptacidiphilus sp. EB129]|uniref:replication-relaxation family protein n=1 Tax=Streptacidiphilus sp. EB129 TaxID=3156262 RepID=UPI00351845F6
MAGEGEPDTAAAPAPVRPTAKRPRANGAGSTARVRAEVLTVLGVLNVVTADRLWRLLRPEARENKFARAALNDLQSARLVHSEGRTSTGHKTWGLTTQGRDAAQQVMPAGREVGNIARGARRSGAPHAMAVNETILAFVTGGTDPAAGPGMGTVLSWTTEVVHEAPNKRRTEADQAGPGLAARLWRSGADRVPADRRGVHRHQRHPAAQPHGGDAGPGPPLLAG